MRKFIGGYPSKRDTAKLIIDQIKATISGMADSEECPRLEFMIQKALTFKETHTLCRLLDKVWNTDPEIPEHKIEGSISNFDRYIAGDR